MSDGRNVSGGTPGTSPYAAGGPRAGWGYSGRRTVGAMPHAVAMVLLTAVALAAPFLASTATAANAPYVLATGTKAPSGTFTTVAGDTGTVAGPGGAATLLWLVTTSCQSCQSGTRALASKVAALASLGVRVVELDASAELGQRGPSIEVFGKRNAGRAYGSKSWTWGVASKALVAAYDPAGYDNVYYLISGDGVITYVNGSPARTMPALMTAAVDLSRGLSGPIGPEGVPEPTAPPLAGLGNAATGAGVDGIACSASEQTAVHLHTHLTIFVAGKQVSVPGGIGIAPPRSSQASPYGAFVNGGRCLYWLHTHAADGIIHIESPTRKPFTLGDFFDLWGVPLAASRVGPSEGKVTAFVGGKAYAGDPRAIRLGDDVQIQLDVGVPVVAPRLIQFPPGL